MAALSANESANKVWQRVQKGLTDASPAIQNSFRQLKAYLAQQRANPDLQVAFFSRADSVIAATGTVVGTGTPKVYAVYAKKGTVATASWLKVCDDATGAVTGNVRLSMHSATAGEELAFVNPNPVAYSAGIAVQATTTAVGTTSSTGATTGFGGFVVFA